MLLKVGDSISVNKKHGTVIYADKHHFVVEYDWGKNSTRYGYNWTDLMRKGVKENAGGYGAEGKLVLDDMFTQHIEGAQSVGLPVGVYFFTQALNYEEGAAEAQFVLEAIKDYSVTYPVIIDTEMLDVAEARTYGQSVSDRTDAVIGFCETIKTAGYVPMVYANRNWYVQSLDMTRLGDYELWLAHYTNQTDFPYRFIGWQYTSEGQVAGIPGSVDMNVWFRQD